MNEGQNTNGPATRGHADGGGLCVHLLAAGAILQGLVRDAPAALAALWLERCIAHTPVPPTHLDGVHDRPAPGAARSCGWGHAALPWAAVSLAGSRPAIDKGSTTRHVCAGCHQHLTTSDLEHLEEQQEQSAPRHLHPHRHLQTPGAVLQCDGCHRCFHGRCHRRWAAAAEQEQRRRARVHAARAVRDGSGRRQQPEAVRASAAAVEAGDPGDDGAWFHDTECKQVRVALLRLCRRGDIWLPEGTSPAAPAIAAAPPASAAASSSSGSSLASAPDNAAASAPSGAAPGTSPPTTSTATPHSPPQSPQQPRQRLRMRLYDCNDGGPAAAVGMRRVHGVLRAAGFGYGLSDLRQFDVAALLMAEDSGQALSAAVLDVYGSHFAELYLLATSAAVQRRGYGRTLVRQLERELAASGVRRLLVSVDDDDLVNQGLWRHAMGFGSVPDTELRELARSWGAFGPAARRGTVFLYRPLLGGAGEAQGQGQHGKR